MLKFPANTLDDREALARLLGSFWARTYEGRAFVQSMMFARAQEERQTQNDYQETVQAISRYTVPIFHQDNWYQLRILQSELNTQPIRYGDDYLYGTQVDGGAIHYGDTKTQVDYVTAVPAELRELLVITNRITAPSVVLHAGMDFVLEEGLLRFATNPFENELLEKHPVYTGSEVTDWALPLWLFRSQWDWRHIYLHFGYLLGSEKRSSLNYREFVNAVLDAWTQGTSRRHLEALFAAVLGAPVARGDETVRLVQEDRNYKWVISDKQAYPHPKAATIIVSEGDELVAGQQLSDTVTFYEFTRGGEAAAIDDLLQLSLDTQFLLPGFLGGLTFPNAEVPLVVEENVAGKTKVSFQIGGIFADVDRFFDLLHSRASELGTSTLAELLDVRGSGQTTQPTAASLPATINPCRFLIQNVLRYNFAAVRLKLSAAKVRTHSSDLQLLDARVIRRMIPPWQALLILIELEAGDEECSLAAPVSDEFGSDDDAESFSAGEPDDEASDLTTFLTEDVQLFYVPCPCV